MGSNTYYTFIFFMSSIIEMPEYRTLDQLIEYEGALNSELHTHSVFSNITQQKKSLRGFNDCGTTPREICETMLRKNIKALFITDHDTVVGYSALQEEIANHEKFSGLGVYRGEEITADDDSHVGAIGIDGYIKPGGTVLEIKDEIRKHNGIAIAYHPFAVKNGMRELAREFGYIETFNSNNRDGYSNDRAEELANRYNKKKTNGSDSHLTQTIGIAPNLIYAENNLDSIMEAFDKGKVEPSPQRRLRTFEESLQHGKYVLDTSHQNVLKYLEDKQSSLSYFSKDIAKKVACRHIAPYFLKKAVKKNIDSKLFRACGKLFMSGIRRTSYNVNVKGMDPSLLQKNFIWRNLENLM